MTAVMEAIPGVAKLSERDNYVLALHLHRAYLLDDPDETTAYIWWIQHRTGLNDEQFAPSVKEAREAAESWRAADRIEEILNRITYQLGVIQRSYPQ